jgi:hypothetical protein
MHVKAVLSSMAQKIDLSWITRLPPAPALESPFADLLY